MGGSYIGHTRENRFQNASAMSSLDQDFAQSVGNRQTKNGNRQSDWQILQKSNFAEKYDKNSTSLLDQKNLEKKEQFLAEILVSSFCIQFCSYLEGLSQSSETPKIINKKFLVHTNFIRLSDIILDLLRDYF